MTAPIKLGQHAEWLSLIEVSGPFLAESILKDAFPQGLEKIDPMKKTHFRQTYEEWREIIDSHDENDIAIKEQIHREWINWVIKFGLEWDEDEDGDILKQGDAIPESVQAILPEHGVTLRPEFAVYADENKKPYLLFTSYYPDTKLDEVIKGESWSTTPAERMAHLCRAVGTRLGIITNGEQWLFIDAPEGGITTYASWYARLWSQEPVTLQAFFSLFNIGTIFNGFEDAKKLTDILDESLKHQDEVTETLGEQVSRAVEVLIQSLDRINQTHNGKLLEGVAPTELYEAGLTLMMRLVFLLCAEERGLLLLGDETYESNYALSTLRLKLREEAGLHGEEVLSYRKNAWSRLLAIFRAVYGGVEHENMRMPALGGSLFDPDRFPFLEGRARGSHWKVEEAKPLPIDNRTVLLFLDAIQIYQGRTLSYRALDVEQIGYVYEGLLEKTVIRAPDVTLELNGSKSAKTPWVELKQLASVELDGDAAVKELLKERTNSSAGRVNSDFDKALSDAQLDNLLVACHGDVELRGRLKPYYHFLRLDAWANPLVYPKDAFMVTTGTDRRETGTHYTPKSLTESIVKETLEPIVYVGPAEGEPKDKWRLKSSAELLNLKICDLAMGSGAFLVQVCRWLAERVCEAWLIEEQNGKIISAEGAASNVKAEEILPVDAEERLVIAKRLIAERCLYGVDINPLAVELAKLSIWLVTLSKGRPFGFLDHNIKHGDSLLGLHDLNQLYYLDMNPSKMSEGGGSAKQLFAQDIEKAVEEALVIRKQIRTMPIRDIHDVETMANMEREAEAKLVLPELVADAMIGNVLANKGKQSDSGSLGAKLGDIFLSGDLEAFKKEVNDKLKTDLDFNRSARKPFHWCLEFPEVFDDGGFNAIVGNPPFVWGNRISSKFGDAYRAYLYICDPYMAGNSDLCAVFLYQGVKLLNNMGILGLITTNSISETDNRTASLDPVISHGSDVIWAMSDLAWPGKANIRIAMIILGKKGASYKKCLNGQSVGNITAFLDDKHFDWEPQRLQQNKKKGFKGVDTGGMGFVLDEDEIKLVPSESKKLVEPLLNGKDFLSNLNSKASRKVINFTGLTIKQAGEHKYLYSIVLERVKPVRDGAKRKSNRENWWIYNETRPGLYKAIKGLDQVIINCVVSKYICFSLVDSKQVFTNAVNIFAFNKLEDLGLLQSTIHEVWARKYGSSLEDRNRYNVTDSFETFPFIKDKLICEVAKLYFEIRSNICSKRSIGLTEFYNLINEESQNSADIIGFRSVMKNLDLKVLNVYGWDDIDLNHGFHHVDYLPEGKNLRYTISERAREELLFRLGVLNKEMYEAECQKTDKKVEKISSKKEKQSELF